MALLLFKNNIILTEKFILFKCINCSEVVDNKIISFTD